MRVIPLLCIVSLVICTQMMNQATMFEEQLGSLSNTKLGKTILNFISLQQFAQVDFSQLFIALDDISASINQAQDEEKQSLDAYYTQFLSDSDFYNNQVTQYQTEVAQHNSDITTLRQDRNSLQQSLYDKSSLLQENQRNQANLERTINNNDQSTTKKNAEYDQSISIIDQVITKLAILKSSSFIQIDKEDLAISTQTFNRRMNEISHLPTLYEPLSKILIEMTSQGFADQEQAGNAIKLLNSLREDLVASKNALLLQANTDKETNQGILDSLSETITLLSSEIIPQLKSDISTKDGEIQTKQNLLQDAQNNLNNSQSSLDNVNLGWTNRQQQNNQLNDGWANELLIISQAEQALERGGIIRQ